MTLVLPTSASKYIHIPDTQDYIPKQSILQNHNWLQQHELLQGNQAVMITSNDSVVLDQILLSEKAYDGAGNLIDPSELRKIFNERHEVRNPWRAEYIDALFEERGHLFSREELLYLSQNHQYIGKDSKGIILIPKYSQELNPDTLRENRRIDLLHFIKEAHTSQGLPREDVKEGDFYYYRPVNGRVAGLGAGSVRAVLYCNWVPSSLGAGLGVRAKISTGNLNQFIEELRDKYKVHKY